MSYWPPRWWRSRCTAYCTERPICLPGRAPTVDPYDGPNRPGPRPPHSAHQAFDRVDTLLRLAQVLEVDHGLLLETVARRIRMMVEDLQAARAVTDREVAREPD